MENYEKIKKKQFKNVKKNSEIFLLKNGENYDAKSGFSAKNRDNSR